MKKDSLDLPGGDLLPGIGFVVTEWLGDYAEVPEQNNMFSYSSGGKNKNLFGVICVVQAFDYPYVLFRVFNPSSPKEKHILQYDCRVFEYKILSPEYVAKVTDPENVDPTKNGMVGRGQRSGVIHHGG